MLNVGRLQVLHAVAEHGSFSAAAASLSYTQSAVSQSISRLEAEVGVALLDRGRRGVTPTPAGEALIGHTGRILAEVAAAEATLARVTGERLARLRVGSFPSGGAALMPLAVARLRRAHPEVALTLAEGEPEEIVARLRAGELDLALLFDFADADADADVDADGGDPAPVRRRPGPSMAGLRPRTLLEDPMDLVLSAGHPLAGRPGLSLIELAGEPWVQTSAASPCARHVVHCCAQAGFTPDVSFESDDYDTVLGLVAAGVGVALVPRLALGPPRPGLVVSPLSPMTPFRHVFVATAPGVTPAPAATALIASLAEVAGRYAAGSG